MLTAVIFLVFLELADYITANRSILNEMA